VLNSGFDVERNEQREVIAYVTAEEMGKLEALGFSWTELPDPGLEEFLARQQPKTGRSPRRPPTTTTPPGPRCCSRSRPTTPAIARRLSAGKSVQGRELWWMKISDNPDVEEDEPAFKFRRQHARRREGRTETSCA